MTTIASFYKSKLPIKGRWYCLIYQSSTPRYYFQLDNKGKYTKSFLACANQTVDWASLPKEKFQGLI